MDTQADRHTPPDLDAADMAQLELIGISTQTEHQARTAFLRLASDYGEDVALGDHNARASRYSKSFDGKYRSVAWTHADSTNGATLQHFWSWEKLTAKHNKYHPERKLSERQFRALSYELARKFGVLEIRNRQRKDTVAPDKPWPLRPLNQTSSLFTVHVGLAVAHGQVVHYDYNAPLSESADTPRPVCHCGKRFEPKRADQEHCSSVCKQRAYRARQKAGVTDSSTGTAADVPAEQHLTPFEHPVEHPPHHQRDDESGPSARDLEEEHQEELEAEAWLESMGMVFPVFINAAKKSGIDDLVHLVSLLLDLKHRRIRGWQGNITPPMIIAHLDSIYETWKQQVAEATRQARLDAAEALETKQRLDAEHAERDRKLAELVELAEEHARMRGTDPEQATIMLPGGRTATTAEYARERASKKDLAGLDIEIENARKRLADQRHEQHRDEYPDHYLKHWAGYMYNHRDDIDCEFSAK